MMYNAQYLPKNFEQRRLEKTILGHFPYNLNMRSRWAALIQDGRKNHESAYVNVNQQSQYTIRNFISKLALNWLTNLKGSIFFNRPFIR